MQINYASNIVFSIKVCIAKKQNNCCKLLQLV